MDLKPVNKQKVVTFTETDIEEALAPHRDQLFFLGEALEQAIQMNERSTRGLGGLISQIEQNLGLVSKEAQ